MIAPLADPLLSTSSCGCCILANGHFQMIFNVPAASAAIFQASTNLIDWIPLMTNSPFNGSFLFDDSLASSYTNRFYQLLFVP